MMSTAIPHKGLSRGGHRGSSNLLRVLPDRRERQLRVRSDVRARLPCELKASLKNGLRPSDERPSRIPQVPEVVFIIQGAAQRHERLPWKPGFSHSKNTRFPSRNWIETSFQTNAY